MSATQQETNYMQRSKAFAGIRDVVLQRLEADISVTREELLQRLSMSKNTKVLRNPLQILGRQALQKLQLSKSSILRDVTNYSSPKRSMEADNNKYESTDCYAETNCEEKRNEDSMDEYYMDGYCMHTPCKENRNDNFMGENYMCDNYMENSYMENNCEEKTADDHDDHDEHHEILFEVRTPLKLYQTNDSGSDFSTPHEMVWLCSNLEGSAEEEKIGDDDNFQNAALTPGESDTNLEEVSTIVTFDDSKSIPQGRNQNPVNSICDSLDLWLQTTNGLFQCKEVQTFLSSSKDLTIHVICSPISIPLHLVYETKNLLGMLVGEHNLFVNHEKRERENEIQKQQQKESNMDNNASSLTTYSKDNKKRDLIHNVASEIVPLVMHTADKIKNDIGSSVLTTAGMITNNDVGKAVVHHADRIKNDIGSHFMNFFGGFGQRNDDDKKALKKKLSLE